MKTMSTRASLSFTDKASRHTTVKWSTKLANLEQWLVRKIKDPTTLYTFYRNTMDCGSK